MGACLATEEAARAMVPGTHGTTFGGNPLACAAALATMEIIESDDLRAMAGAQLGILKELADAQPIPGVTEIRGLGAMLGIQFGERAQKQAAPLAAACQAEGLLVTVCGGHTVRWLLPYFAGVELLGEAWRRLGRAAATL